MAVLLVAYQLKTVGKDYAPFHDTVQKTANGWCHYIDNVWIVNTHLTAHQFAEKLYPHMTKDDWLLVTRISAEYQGWLPKDAWDWLNTQIY
jgi:hypothetical protein